MFDNLVFFFISFNQLWIDLRSQIKIEEVKFINVKFVLEFVMEFYDFQLVSILEYICGEIWVYRYLVIVRQIVICFISWLLEEQRVIEVKCRIVLCF